MMILFTFFNKIHTFLWSNYFLSYKYAASSPKYYFIAQVSTTSSPK